MTKWLYPWSRGLINTRSSLNVIYHINRLKSKIFTFILTEEEKSYDKPFLFHDKNAARKEKLKKEGNFLN
jgi:hypothetical protein